MRVHAVQFNPAWEAKEENRERIEAMLEEARLAEGDIVILPEMCLTGFSMDTAKTVQSAEREDESFLAMLAVRHGCAVMGGVVSPAPGRAQPGQNEAVAFSPTGALMGRYVKRQPFSLVGEEAKHAAGSAAVVFGWGGFKIAPLICYDLRFPELARDAVRSGGADMLVCIASWPVKRVQHWVTLLQARAIENQAYVIGVNRCGRDPLFSYPGRTMVVDPHGVIVADGSDREGLVSTECDPAVVTRWRDDFPALVDAGLKWGSTKVAVGASRERGGRGEPEGQEGHWWEQPGQRWPVTVGWNLGDAPSGGEGGRQPLPTLSWQEHKKIIHQIDKELSQTTLSVPRDQSRAGNPHP